MESDHLAQQDLKIQQQRKLSITIVDINDDRSNSSFLQSLEEEKQPVVTVPNAEKQIEIKKNGVTLISNPFKQVATFHTMKNKSQARSKENGRKSEVINQIPAKEMNDGYFIMSETLSEDEEKMDQLRKKRQNNQSSGSSESDESVTYKQ